MPYAAPADLRARFQGERSGDVEIDDLAGTGDARLTAALADASIEIDSVIGHLFVLPLPAAVWPLLRSVACDIARLRLYDDEAPKRVMGAASAARSRLRRLAGGELALVDDAGRLAPRRPLVQATGPEPVMTRAALDDA